MDTIISLSVLSNLRCVCAHCCSPSGRLVVMMVMGGKVLKVEIVTKEKGKETKWRRRKMNLSLTIFVPQWN